MRQHTHLMGKRLLSSALAILLAAACIVPAAAAEPIGDGVTPTYDEAYYATLDYYGNLLDGSVVKSYGNHRIPAIPNCRPDCQRKGIVSRRCRWPASAGAGR